MIAAPYFLSNKNKLNYILLTPKTNYAIKKCSRTCGNTIAIYVTLQPYISTSISMLTFQEKLIEAMQEESA